MKNVIYTLLLAILLGAGSMILTPASASATAASNFSAGRIIDDEIFYNKSSMNGAQAVQDFINAHTPACDTWGTQPSGYQNLTNAKYAASVGWPSPPYVCLQNYYENPSTGETSFEKGGGAFDGGQSAAQIIWNASQQYSINPQVLLVTLRKESLNLFGDAWPIKSQYKYAMGYGCPDSGPNYSANCASEKGGFYNQVNLAAWQLRYYYDHMGSYNFAPGRWNTIQYNPQPSCGTKDVYIENYATASLYIYTPYTPNDASVEAYPGEAPCGAYGNRNFWYMFNEWFGSTIVADAHIIARGHVSTIGWMDDVKNNGIIGTTGQGKPLEAVMIQGEVEYSTYSASRGWQPSVNLGMVSGTTGMGEPIQAIKINPVGLLATKYDIYYRAHVSNVGWMSWTKNGLPAGVIGVTGNNLEAIETMVVMKGITGPATGSDSYRNTSTYTYAPQVAINTKAHVSSHGWQPIVTDTMQAGTIKQKLAIEAVQLTVTNNSAFSGGIAYSAHVSGIGWQRYAFDGATAGTTGQNRQMEAIRIGLTGELQNNYDIWYRAHVQGFGWLGWAKNNQPAGSIGAGLRLEALEVRVVPKNSAQLAGLSYLYNPKNRPTPISYTLMYSAHVSTLGWVPTQKSPAITGTTGKSLPMEAFRIDADASAFGDMAISCTAYVRDTGWLPPDPTAGAACGTVDQSKPLQAIKLSLTGAAASKYNLTYRVHVSNVGWMDSVASGQVAGTPGSNSIEAIVLSLTEKY